MLRARFPALSTIHRGHRRPALAQSTASAHRIDGTFSNLAWEGAAVVRGFVQRDPREGAPATLPTEVRIVYDTANVYVAVRAFDPEPSRLVGFLTRRDARTSSDWIRVLIDSYHDRRTAYEFAVNPAGVKQDVYWYNDATSDDSWDAIWDVVVSQDTEGWRAEFRIPFSQLRFAPRRMLRSASRFVPRSPGSTRSPHGRSCHAGQRVVSSFGELTGSRSRLR